MTPAETRERRKELTRLALAEIVRHRIAEHRLRQTEVARSSGISRSFLRAILGARKGMSMFVFLELSDAMGTNPGELLSDVLKRRDDRFVSD